MLAIFFLCTYAAGELKLSNESADAEWLTLEVIEKRIHQGTLLGELEDYKRAFRLFPYLQQ